MKSVSTRVMERDMRRIATCVLFLGVACLWAVARDHPFQVVTWPDSGQPILRSTSFKFKDIGGMGIGHTYITDTTADNFSDTAVSGASLERWPVEPGGP